MHRVAIVDYGLCNVDSVARAIEECGGTPTITDSPDDLANADHIVLPGVGAFPDAMANLRSLDLDSALRQQVIGEGAPLLGICLGMQLLATVGEEIAATPGLDLVPGTVTRLIATVDDRRVPHMGWNEVYPSDGSELFKGIEPGSDFYFVHSYHLVCVDPEAVEATTPYCDGFTSAIASGNIFGVQFHPEKSQQAGFQLLRNFLGV
jgi:glutamine amidotransferase